MNRIAFVCLIALAIGPIVSSAQRDTKSWTEWTDKDVQKILSESPWVQTQIETEEAMGSTAAATTTSLKLERDASKPAPGAVTAYIKYFIRFLSARPIRQAVARKLELEHPEMDRVKTDQLKTFAEAGSDEFIVISVTAEASDKKMGGGAMQALNSATMESLKDSTYLERKDGQRLLLMGFSRPINDGLGAKFIFPRNLNGQAFVKEDAGTLRFSSQLNKTIKLNARFKVSDLAYNGHLEY